MADSIISIAERKFVYVSNKIEVVAKQALILLAKTISKLVFRVQFFFMECTGEQENLINQLSNALSQGPIWNWRGEKYLKELGLRLIDEFYHLVNNESSVSKAFKGTWEILNINFY